MAPNQLARTVALLILPRDERPVSECARPLPGEHGAVLAIGITNLQLFRYISSAATAITFVAWLSLSFLHIRNYTVPDQQRQIIRILFMNMISALLSLAAVYDYQISIYIEPIAGAYEAFCIAALFLLYAEYACPDPALRDAFYHALPNRDKKKREIPGGSLSWYHYTFMMCLQYPLTKVVAVAAEIATQAADVYCINSLKPQYAHIWLDLISYFIIGGAIGACIRFFGRLKHGGYFTKEHRATAKILTFKGLVILKFIQGFFFGLLNGKTIKPSPALTYDDIYYGIPSVLICLEAAISAIIYHWSFTSRPYRSQPKRPSSSKSSPSPNPRTSTIRAVLDALNLTDIISGSLQAFRILLSGAFKGHAGPSSSTGKSILSKVPVVRMFVPSGTKPDRLQKRFPPGELPLFPKPAPEARRNLGYGFGEVSPAEYGYVSRDAASSDRNLAVPLESITHADCAGPRRYGSLGKARGSERVPPPYGDDGSALRTRGEMV